MKHTIYRIINSMTQRQYVGRATDIEYRWGIHLRSLRLNEHPNRQMQDDYNIHGRRSFSIEIIEIVDEVEVKQRERYWIQQVDCDRLYNVQLMKAVSDVTKVDRRRGKKGPRSQTWIDHIRCAMTGKVKTDATKQKIGETQKRRWAERRPRGER